MRVARIRGGEPNGGRHLVAWARAAGIERTNIKATASVWCYSDQEERSYWSNLWIDRLRNSSLRTNMISDGHATEADLDQFVRSVRWLHCHRVILYKSLARPIG